MYVYFNNLRQGPQQHVWPSTLQFTSLPPVDKLDLWRSCAAQTFHQITSTTENSALWMVSIITASKLTVQSSNFGANHLRIDIRWLSTEMFLQHSNPVRQHSKFGWNETSPPSTSSMYARGISSTAHGRLSAFNFRSLPSVDKLGLWSLCATPVVSLNYCICDPFLSV